jgi:hypothetical protein
MHRSLCSRVAVPTPNPTGDTECLGRTFVGCDPCVRSFNSTAWRADGHRPSTNLFQLSGSTTPPAGDDHVDVSGAMLSRLSLL